MTPELEARQIKLENDYTTEGMVAAVNQWSKDLADGRLADTSIGRAITVRIFDLVKGVLEANINAGTRGMGGKYRKLIKNIGVDKATVVAIRVALQCFSTRVANTGAAARGTMPCIVQDYITKAGTSMETEYMLSMLDIAAPGYMHKVLKSMDESNTTSLNHRRRTFRKSADNVGVGADLLTWDTATRDGVAKILLTAAVDAGLVKLGRVEARGGQSWISVEPADAVTTSIERMASCVHAHTRFPPMLVPPTPHTRENLFNGSGYLTPGMFHQSPSIVIKNRIPEYKQWIRENISDLVLEAANTAASVPYTIDTDVIQKLQEASKLVGDTELAGIPGSAKIIPPPYPHPDNWNREDPTLMAIHNAWKDQAKVAYTRELERRAHMNQFYQIMRYLREFKDDVLYFPTYLDWRGRLYFRSRVNPQGTDFVKASLRFANGVALGKRGLYWLKVHVATCYGFDSAHFDTRAVWTDTNIDMIRDAVANLLDSDFFMAADSHWCFYAAAKDLIAALDSGNPEAYVSHIPVAMDATCSGLQHLSAITRDPVGGMMTNLMPNNGQQKEDIYAGVAAIAVTNIQKDAENLEMAQYWLSNGVPRSMAKRPVMTYTYGGTLQSSSEYVVGSMYEASMEPLELYSLYKLGMYVSRHLRQGVESAVPRAATFMRFLRQAAGAMPKDTPMRWVSPAGFPVIQHYGKEDRKITELAGLGIKVIMRVFHEDELERRRCMNGIAPNFVHSLDSSHLCRVIVAWQGDLVPIHDSFGSHAAHMDELHKVLRTEFVSMYSETDPAQQLVDYVKAHTGEDIAIPEKGTLDLNLVNHSVFFMC